MIESNYPPIEGDNNQPQPTICSSCGGTSGRCVRPLAPPLGCRREKIRQIFLANGFKIKPDLGDLRPYVYEAAEALLAAFNAPNGQEKSSEPAA